MANEENNYRLRLVYADASETRMDVVFEADGHRLNPGGTSPTTDPRLLPIVPKTAGALAEDDKLILYVYDYGLGTQNFDTNSELEIPVSIRNVKTGVVSEKMLVRSDFFSSDVTTTSNTWVRVGAYTVSAQEQLKIGHQIAENSRIKVVLRVA